MSLLLNIGEFARLTHLSVKALRHYDDLVEHRRIPPTPVLAFLPLAHPVAGRRLRSPRVELVELPEIQVAVTVHHGPFNDIDTAYGALGTYVTERLIAAPGPIREHYLADSVEVCWPIRSTDPSTTEQGATP